MTAAVFTFMFLLLFRQAGYGQQCGSLSTINSGGNSCGGGAMFDVKATSRDLILNGFSARFSATGSHTVNIYYKTGTYAGSETTSSAWTLLESLSTTASSTTALTTIPLTKKLTIKSGVTHGIYVNYSASYTNGTSTYNDAELQISAGAGLCSQFGGVNAGRIFNGSVSYCRAARTGNDAGIEAIEPKTFCAGAQDIKAVIKNFGNNQINSVKINWTKDGMAQTPVTYTGTLDTADGSGSISTTITLGSHIFVAETPVNIKVWTSDVNSDSDTLNNNDTISVTIASALSGTYTIGTSSSYASFTAAAADLIKYGVCGPVIFNVKAATFTDRLVLTEIPGASATNTITFKGASKTTTTIGFAGTAIADAPVIVLDGADYVTIRDMTIDCKSTSNTGYGVGVLLTNEADNNVIKNCNIKMPATATGTNFLGIVGTGVLTSFTTSGDFGNDNLFEGNTITGGYYGIRLYGDGSANLADNNRIINNTIDQVYTYGLYLYYQDGIIVRGNTIKKPRSNTGDAVYTLYQSDFVFENNSVHGSDYGMYFSNPNDYLNGGGQSRIANNLIVSDDNYGLYITSGSKIDIYHNSIHSLSGTPASVYITTTKDIDLRNNIIVKSGTGALNVFNSPASSTYLSQDYNIFYAPGSTSPYLYGGVTYKTFEDFQLAITTYNKNSLDVDPGFVSAADLHLASSNALRPHGANIGITTDFDGNARCVALPTIGADESSVGKVGKMSVAFSAPDTMYVSSPAEVAATLPSNQAQTLTWYFDGKLLGSTPTMEVTPPTAGTYELKLVAENCDSKDSFRKNIIVANPTRKPDVQFLANKNVIIAGQTVQLTELTDGGATSFSWEISPASGFVDGNKVTAYSYAAGDTFSRNPILRFNLGGAYKVCLTASNSQGSNTLCKEEYIRVIPAHNMAKTVKTIRDTIGFLFDDGGPDNDYSTLTAPTGVLISPCAEEVSLVISSLDLECGWDYLRIYDGTNNKGIPLYNCAGPGFTGYAGATCANTCLPSVNDTFVAKSGSMYVEFTTDGGGVRGGFEAFWTSRPKSFAPPVADFTAPDSICIENLVAFMSTSKGDDLSYFWDLDGNISDFEDAGANTSYGYLVPGMVDISLVVVNCGGADTMTRTLRVYNPVAPVTNFTADNVNPTINDIVYFSPSMPMCVSEYRWRFTAAGGSGTAKFMNGTKNTSAVPQVLFSDTGCYHASLYTKNNTGEDSLELKCFIRVKSPYCVPSVTSRVPDIGISEVEIHTLKSVSSQGVNEYENFTATRSVTLETGVTYDLTIRRTTNVNEVTRTVWIDWNLDGDFTDAGEKVAEQINSIAKDWTANITVPASTLPGATIMRIAINHGGRTNDPCGPNRYGEYEDYRVYITPDLTAPVITLLGDDTVEVEQGYSYTEAGATAQDNLDGNITAELKMIVTPKFDNMIPRDYLVHFDVQDKAGNPAERVTRVIRVTPDKTAPDLIVAGTDTIYVAVGDQKYKDPEATFAEDLIDGDLISQVVTAGSADPMVTGVYTITYFVEDQLGNKAVVTRTIIVQDLVAPSIALSGMDTIYHEINTPYTDAGVTVSDNYNTGLENDVIVTGNVNTAVTGTYVLVYNVEDESGNSAAPVTRVVIVRDTEAPLVTINGNASVKLEVFSTYIDQGASVDDNSGAANLVITGTYPDNFPDGKATVIGDYTIVYTATDASGNTTTVTRDIKVVDETAPLIALDGRPGVNVCRWAVYTDEGYTVSDNYDAEADLIVTVDGDFANTQIEGIYNFRYRAEDKSGNVSYSEYRIINVKPAGEAGCITGVNALGGLEKSVNVYPNPSSGRFTVSITLESPRQVSIKVLNPLGQVIETVSEGTLTTGAFPVDLSAHAGGVYLLQITAGDQTAVKRVVISK